MTLLDIEKRLQRALPALVVSVDLPANIRAIRIRAVYARRGLWLDQFISIEAMYSEQDMDGMVDAVARHIQSAFDAVDFPLTVIQPRTIQMDEADAMPSPFFQRTVDRWDAIASAYTSPGVRVPVLGDHESAVSEGAVTELVALAKAGNREDFDFLAGACGVEDRETLWSGTRARLGKSAVAPEQSEAIHEQA